MSIGASGIVAGLLVLLARGLLIREVENTLVKDDSVRPAARAVASIATGMLSEVAGAAILIGVVIVLAAWFAGPARSAVRARRAIAPHLRDYPIETYAGLAALLLLIFIWQPIPATGTPLGMIVFTVFAVIGTETLRRQTALEFGQATSQVVDGQHLEHLTVLQDAGALTTDEVDAAKARLDEREPVKP
jgi:ABC-type xylose transport system permease subunit